jgi:glycosyltransferase involved in cell wall biosynthesis
MKIACIGNLNHQEFIAARYLRDMGHDVTLFLLEEQSNFVPENDTYNAISKIKIEHLPWKHKDLYSISTASIKERLYGFDCYFASEYAPAFLFKAGIKPDVFIPIGTDLITYPFKKVSSILPPEWEINEQQFHLYQKAGIRLSNAIFLNAGGDEFLENALRRIKFTGKRFPMSPPYLYLPDFLSDNAHSKFEAEVLNLKNANNLLLMSHGRCEFTDKTSVHNKGTDILLKGLRQFIDKTNHSVCLILFEYGTDVTATKQLIAELKLEAYIHWLPVVGRKDIFPLFKYVDIAVGNLYHSLWSYNVAMEASAAGVPLVQKGPASSVENLAIYPYLKAGSSEEFSGVLEDYVSNTQKHREMAEKSSIWFLENSINRPLKEIEKYLSEVHNKKYPAVVKENLKWVFLSDIVRLISKLRLWLQLRLRIKPSTV